jgi:hypothetical protein
MSEEKPSQPFDTIPHSIEGHFLLNFYAAILRLLNYIYRMSEFGGDDLSAVLDAYPFLGRYFAGIQDYVPDDVTWNQASKWWEREIEAWEEKGKERLPLKALTDLGIIGLSERIALMVVGIVEEDSRFGTLFAKLQEPLHSRRVCLELVGQMMKNGTSENDRDPWAICKPLLSSGLVQVLNENSPRSEWILRVPSVLWDAIRGRFEPDPVSWWRYHPPEHFRLIDDLILPGEVVAQIREIPPLVESGEIGAVILRGSPGSERCDVMGAVARELGFGIIKMEGSAPEVKTNWKLIGPLCSMAHALAVFSYDLVPGETMNLDQLGGYKGPIGVAKGFEGGLRGFGVDRSISLTLPPPNEAERLRYWTEALQGRRVEDMSEIAARFHLPAKHIRQAGAMAAGYAALGKRKAIRTSDVKNACRFLNRQLLDTLADRLETAGSWDRLIAGPATTSRLRELEYRCRHRERLLSNLGVAFEGTSNQGVRVLLNGASGTGKTLAAKILAAQLDMEIYRVDLASVVNKYIGETEKNLHKTFTVAEECDVILLLDEGDALLSNRTNVSSANDRYANLETGFLLQRLENYNGIVVVTTNVGENIDFAFQRRMDVVIHFVPPNPKERLAIWKLHLPRRHAIRKKRLRDLSTRCAMTGGQIRNAAVHASMLALEDGGRKVESRHLEEAIRNEYRKTGAICPIDGGAQAGDWHGGTKAFLDRLSA